MPTPTKEELLAQLRERDATIEDLEAKAAALVEGTDTVLTKHKTAEIDLAAAADTIEQLTAEIATLKTGDAAALLAERDAARAAVVVAEADTEEAQKALAEAQADADAAEIRANERIRAHTAEHFGGLVVTLNTPTALGHGDRPAGCVLGHVLPGPGCELGELVGALRNMDRVTIESQADIEARAKRMLAAEAAEQERAAAAEATE